MSNFDVTVGNRGHVEGRRYSLWAALSGRGHCHSTKHCSYPTPTGLNLGLDTLFLIYLSMAYSSSSSPEISVAPAPQSQDQFSYKSATHDEVLEDLSRSVPRIINDDSD